MAMRGHLRLLSRLHRRGRRGKGTVAVAMSGGIDSSYSALLLKEQGYDVVGVFMRNWDRGEEATASTSCQSDIDRRDMQQVCARLGIQHTEVEFVKEYWLEVFIPFLEAYKTGTETPNPDVFCNRFVKFHHFARFVRDRLGIADVATGHYARIAGPGPNEPAAAHPVSAQTPLLRSAVDKQKDQSYFLCQVQSEQLRGVHFPLGGLLKSDVIAAAAASPLAGLRVMHKPESMGLCFVGKRSMPDFLSQYMPLTPGRFVDAGSGAVVGAHGGKELYTVGQGARIAGQPEPYFVVRRDRDCEDVFVARGRDNPLLFSDRLYFKPGSLHWIVGAPPAHPAPEGGSGEEGRVRVRFKSRHNQGMDDGWLQIQGSSSGGGAVLSFDRPQRAITPGQVCAIYDPLGDVCLGGGVILSGDTTVRLQVGR